jgi:hypothetical protein
LWLLPICYFVQEMVARLGIATGKGHAAMIYKRFGKWWGHISLFDLLVANFLTLITEFAAISLALSALGVNPWISVPVSALGLTLMVVTGSYLRWERIVIALCLIDLTWFALAYVVHPNWAAVLSSTVSPSMPAGGITGSLVFLVIAIVGTTIAPWQLFFQQSCVAEKRLRFSDLKWARLDTFIGATFTVLVAGAMMLVGNYGFQHGITFQDPAQFAGAIMPMLGHFTRSTRNCGRLRASTQPILPAWPRLPQLCSSRMCHCSWSSSAFRCSLTDSSLGHHLPSTSAQRLRTTRGSLGQQALEQRHQLDHHCGPLCPVAAAGSAGDAPQSL